MELRRASWNAPPQDAKTTSSAFAGAEMVVTQNSATATARRVWLRNVGSWSLMIFSINGGIVSIVETPFPYSQTTAGRVNEDSQRTRKADRIVATGIRDTTRKFGMNPLSV